MCLHVHRLGLLAFGLWPVQSMRSLKFKFKIDNKTRQTRQTNLWFGLGLCVCASDNVASRQPTIRLQACLQCNVQDLKTMEQLLQRILYQVDSKETHRPINNYLSSVSRGKTELESYDCVLGNIRNLTQV